MPRPPRLLYLVPATPSIRSFYDPRNQRVRLEDGP